MARPGQAARSLLRMAGLLALLALPAPVQGAPFVLDLSATVAAPVPIPELEPRSGASGATDPCQTSFYSADPGQRRFSFNEGSEGNGCLAVVHGVTVPTGVRRVGVDFQADRARTDSGGALALAQPAFEQEIRLRVGGNIVAAVPYFDATQADAAAQPFAIRFDLPPGAKDVELEWWFANHAQGGAASDASAGRLQAWSATVSEPNLVLDEVPLPSPTVREERGQFHGGSYITGFNVELLLPPELHPQAAAGGVSLHLRMPSSALVDRLMTPDGADLLDDEYETAIEGSTRFVTIPEPTIQRLGPGPYSLRFQGTEPVQAEPSMAVLAGVALLMPPVAIVLAARQLRRRSLDTYIEAADALEGELAPR